MLELLDISPAHKNILNQALLVENVPRDLDVDKFQSIVEHLTSPPSLTFSKKCDISISHPHNQPLHIEVSIQQFRVKRILINGGASLNICTFKLVKVLSF